MLWIDTGTNVLVKLGFRGKIVGESENDYNTQMSGNWPTIKNMVDSTTCQICLTLSGPIVLGIWTELIFS